MTSITATCSENRLFYSLRRSGKITEASDIMPSTEFLAYLHREHDSLIEDSPDYDYYTHSGLIRKETITREWLDSLDCGKEHFIYLEDETHQWVIRAYEHKPITNSTSGNLRIYQTVMDDVDRKDPQIGNPLAIDAFIPYVLHEYQTAIDSQWTDELVSKESITREWLEGLAVGSNTQLVGDEGEDYWLRVYVYEVDSGIENPGQSSDTQKSPPGEI